MDKTGKTHETSAPFVGSAVAVAAAYDDESTTLRLQTFTGKCIPFVLLDVPDPAGLAQLQAEELRPISVKIQQSGRRCTVLALSTTGPRSLDVSLGTALAVHRSGVHTVVDGGLQETLPCPTQPSFTSDRTSGRKSLNNLAVNSLLG